MDTRKTTKLGYDTVKEILVIRDWVFSRDFALNVEGNAKGRRLAQKGFSTPWLVILDFYFDEHDFHDLVKKQREITKKTRRHLVDMARFGWVTAGFHSKQDSSDLK
jgi:hypothetical protein